MTKYNWNAETDFPCDDCGGEGGGEADDFSPVSGHFTRPVKCDRCGGKGVLTLPLGEYWQSQFDRVDAENLRQSRELTVAHERIVALTRQLQDLRSGGGAVAATSVAPVGTQDDNHVGFGV